MNNNNEDLPDWLQDIQPEEDFPDRPEIEEPTEGPPPDWMRVATSGSGSSLTEDETPDWLKAVRAGQSVPKEPEAAKPASPADSEGMSDLERLLAEEGIDLNSVSEERPQEAGEMSARDWLIASSSDELIRKRVGSEPIPLPPAAQAGRPPQPEPSGPEGPQPEPPQPQPPASPVTSSRDDKMVVEEDLPDWLRDIPAEEPAAAPFESTVEPPAAPSGQVKVYQPPQESDGMIIDEDLPDWLRDFSEEEAEVAPVEQAPAPVPPKKPGTSPLRDDKMIVEEDLPDWLRDLSAEETTEETAVPVGELPISGIDSDEGEELPDWLRDAAEESVPATPAAARRPDGMVVEEDLPDWLREVEEDSVELAIISEAEEELEPGGRPAGTAEELPDWLREVEEQSTEVEPLAAEFDTTVIAAAEKDEEGLPDWLRAAQEGLPEEPVSAPATQGPDMIVAEELPDWLKDIESETPEEEGELPVPGMAIGEGAKEGAEELPDWLKEIQYEEAAPAPFDLEVVAGVTGTVEDIIDEEGLPDWLQEVEEEVFEPSEPSPEPFADVYAEEGIAGEEEDEEDEEELVIEEELPAWLRAVEAEERRETMAEAAPARETGGETGLIDEEMLPDWLREMEEEEGVPPVEETEPVPTLAAILPAPPSAEAEAEAEEEGIDWTKEPEEAEIEGISMDALPDWLEGLEEELDEEFIPAPDVEEAPPVEAAVPPPPAPEPARMAEPVPTGMPDWLKKLREGFDEEAEPVQPRPLPRPVPVPPPAARQVARLEPVLAAAPPVEVEIEAEALDLPADAAERLKLARAARERGEIEDAARVYDTLVSSGVYLDKIIEDMQQAIKAHPSNYLLFQLMGDAMMKDGRLQSALDAYRQALTRL